MATDGSLSAALRRFYQAFASELVDQPPSAVAAPQTTADDDWAEWEERAAIREYDGGMSRVEAERLTRLELGTCS